MRLMTLSGNIGYDPETNVNTNNLTIRKFSIATEQYRNGQKETVWTKCVLFGKEKTPLQKGMKVAVSGEFVENKYTTKDGVDKISHEVIVSAVSILSWPKDSSQNHPNNEADPF